MNRLSRVTTTVLLAGAMVASVDGCGEEIERYVPPEMSADINDVDYSRFKDYLYGIPSQDVFPADPFPAPELKSLPVAEQDRIQANLPKFVRNGEVYSTAISFTRLAESPILRLDVVQPDDSSQPTDMIVSFFTPQGYDDDIATAVYMDVSDGGEVADGAVDYVAGDTETASQWLKSIGSSMGYIVTGADTQPDHSAFNLGIAYINQ